MSKQVYRWPSPSDERLRELRAMSGEEYWQSQEWRMMRRYVIARDGHRCKVCNRNYCLSVHHRTYKSGRGMEQPDDLVTLCQFCHRNFHENRRLYKEPTKKQKRKERVRRITERRMYKYNKVERITHESRAREQAEQLDAEYVEILRCN